MLQLSAGEFKTHCLKLMDLAQKKGESFIITKRGVPVAKLVPYEEIPSPIFGFMAGSLEIKDDIIQSIDEEWHAEKIVPNPPERCPGHEPCESWRLAYRPPGTG